MLMDTRWSGVALAVVAATSVAGLGGCRGARVQRTAAIEPVASLHGTAVHAADAAATDPASCEGGEEVVCVGGACFVPLLGGALARADGVPAPAPAVPAGDAAPVPAPAPAKAAAADEPPAPAPAAPEAAPTPPEAPAGAPTAAPAPAPAPAEAPETAARKMADDLAKQQAVERERAAFVVAQLLEAARAHEARGEYVEAETALLKARDLAPTNHDVEQELATVQQILSRRGPSATGTLEDLRTKQQVRIDEQRTTAEKSAGLAKVALDRGNYDAAIEGYQNALAIMNSSPFAIDWKNLKQSVETGLAEAVRAKTDTSKALRRNETEKAIGELAKDEEHRLLEEQQRLEGLMFSAVDAFNREEFDLAEDQAQRVLDVQPDNTKARELKDAAIACRHDRIARDQVVKEQRAFAEWRDDMEATKNIEHRILKWPSQSMWDRITHLRAARSTAFGASKANPEEAALAAKLKTTTVNLDVENRPFKEVVQTLQIQTGVNLYIDPRINDVADANVQPIKVEQIPLEQALDMLKGVGPDVLWTIEGNVVKFTKKEFVKRNLTLQAHSVADLTTGLTEFRPPKIDLVMSDQVNDEENPLFGGEGVETVKPYGSAEDLIELVKSAVGPPGTWEVEGATIGASGQSAIIVKHTAEIQAAVSKFLNDLRAFAGIVVTVETRFLSVSDAFLRDVGVDWRGLGGQTPGSLVNLDDVTNGLQNKASAGRDNGGPGLPAGAALNPSAGAYFNDGQDGDFRARTENIFERPLGTLLSSLGGATFTMGFLDDSQFSAIIHAVEKTQMGRTLTAPTITVYNTQRANLTVVNQLSYIQDFDVEVAQTSFIADPIIGVIQDGLTLDVRPTVSNDRRYITLELQPTVAKLVEPIPTFSTTLASSFSPVIIQLPELHLQKARTTVRIPDGGSIVIGGLKNISVVDRQSEIPVFGDIPFLSFLFSRKGRSDEMSNLMILVRAKITDLQEEEARLRSR